MTVFQIDLAASFEGVEQSKGKNSTIELMKGKKSPEVSEAQKWQWEKLKVEKIYHFKDKILKRGISLRSQEFY